MTLSVSRKVEVEDAGDLPADGGLAGPHEADERQVADGALCSHGNDLPHFSPFSTQFRRAACAGHTGVTGDFLEYDGCERSRSRSAASFLALLFVGWGIT